MKEQKTPQLPRKVMVKEYRREGWYEAELIADLTRFGIHANKFPFVIKHREGVGEFSLVNFIMEIEDYKKEFEPKKPMSFGEHFECEYYSPEEINSVYSRYQEYLKTFEK